MLSIQKYRHGFYTFRQSWRSRVSEYVYGHHCLILLYHRVTGLELDPQMLAVSPDNFYAQVKYLKEDYALLDINEFLFLRKKKKKIPRNSVILTFDDGYADNYLEALPILEKLKAQALFYISTSLTGTCKEFWWDELEKIFLLKDNILPQKLVLEANRELFEFDLTGADANIEVYNKLHPIIKPLIPQDREQVINYLLQWSGTDKLIRPTHRVMTPDEIKEMHNSAAGVIGAHTHCHPQLSALSYHEQETEIVTSKNILENITNDKINHFSYPFGTRNDYNEDSIAICKKAGFDMVCSNFPQLADRTADDYQLPRFIVRDWPLETFKYNLKRFAAINE